MGSSAFRVEDKFGWTLYKPLNQCFQELPKGNSSQEFHPKKLFLGITQGNQFKFLELQKIVPCTLNSYCPKLVLFFAHNTLYQALLPSLYQLNLRQREKKYRPWIYHILCNYFGFTTFFAIICAFTFYKLLDLSQTAPNYVCQKLYLGKVVSRQVNLSSFLARKTLKKRSQYYNYVIQLIS